ncbi:MAG: RIP metalloprotease RseP [bacterium]|nr:RIP metalloprotease RseP [bacterium]
MLVTVIVFIVVLGVLVLVHEFGHFYTAKKAGLEVEEFGFGFPPRLASFTRGGTRYSINLIPFGGFVKILGEGGEERSSPKSFSGRGVGIRALIVSAGIIMNFILAAVLFTVTNTLGVKTAIDDQTVLPSYAEVSAREVTVALVDKDGPADQAGLRGGDVLVSVAGSQPTSIEEAVEQITGQSGNAVSLELLRGGTTIQAELTPRLDPPDGQGPIGVQLLNTAEVSYPWYLAPYEAIKQVGVMTARIVLTFGEVISNLISTGNAGQQVAGPVGIAVLTGQFLDLGLVPLLQFVGLLSINLAIINLIPFPALDGGRLLFLAIEKIRRKEISKKVENALHTVGFALLIGLILFVTVRDVLGLI